ncbi:MAG: cysteine-rich KTR domain-containing protein [Oscillospiraceae bacterium]|nr:cysteine-rich KTR domain-containing protein [Oscillospiraceae bacterium]
MHPDTVLTNFPLFCPQMQAGNYYQDERTG